jgi:YHS domain-containing protein
MTEPLPESAEAETKRAERDSFVALCGRVFHADPDYFPKAEYRGRRIYLCTDSCLGAFLSDPDRFVAAHKKKFIAKGNGSTTSEVCLPESASE